MLKVFQILIIIGQFVYSSNIYLKYMYNIILEKLMVAVVSVFSFPDD